MNHHQLRRIPVFFLFMLMLSIISCQRSATPESLLSVEPDIRRTAIDRLKLMKEKKKIPLIDPLLNALYEPDTLTVQRAIEALKFMGPVAALKVKPFLENKDPFLRAAAVEIIAAYALQDASLKTTLETMLKDPHPLVQDEAAFGLSQLKTP